MRNTFKNKHKLSDKHYWFIFPKEHASDILEKHKDNLNLNLVNSSLFLAWY